MRILAALLLAAVFCQVPSQAATAYRYVAICGEDVCLIAADGSTKLELVKSTESTSWSGTAVSPDGLLVAMAATSSTSADTGESLAELFVIDPVNGTRRLVFKGFGFEIPYPPVWLSKHVILLPRWNKDDCQAGVYAVNIVSGKASRVVEPMPDNSFDYDSLLPSPSGKLLATVLDVTAATWFSVNDVDNGRSYWRTGSDAGIDGVSDAQWAPDGKSLFVSFYIDHEMASDSPGGVWKFDAATGKRHPWKYLHKSIAALWLSPDRSELVLERGKRLYYLRASDGKLLFSLPTSRLGGAYDVSFRGAKGSAICGGSRVALVSASGKIRKSYSVRTITKDAEYARHFAEHDSVLYYSLGGNPGALGVVNLASGRVVKFAHGIDQLDWLAHDVVR